jgi:hypothetical protein
MIHSKFSLHNDTSSQTVTLYANTEFGYSIHEFDIDIDDDLNYKMMITDKDKFKTLSAVLKTKPKILEEYITNSFREDYQWQRV